MNNFAISSAGIGEALVRSASSLSSGNNSLDESIALITAANSVVQDTQKVGTALKTVSMYLRAAKTEAEEAGESTEGMANSVSELRSELLALTGGKIDIQIDSNTFKSTYQIMKELSEVWDELTDISRANVLEMVGGKRNSNVVSSLLTNFDVAEESLKSAADSAGSALSENEKVLESIQGRLNILNATFQELSWNIFDADVLKGGIDLANILLTIVNRLAEADVLVQSIIAALVVYTSIRKASDIEKAASSLAARFISEKVATDSLIVSYQSLNVVQQQATIGKLQAAVASGQLTQAEYAEIVAKLGLTTATTGLKSATDGLNISIKSLLKSNPIGWIMLAISFIPNLVSLLGGVHKSNKDLIQDAEDLKKSYSDSLSSIKDNISSLSNLEDEFNKLSDGVDAYGSNVSLASDDYERYQEIVEQILGLSPSLVDGYDKEGNAIANKNELLQRSIELLEEERRLKMLEATSTNSLRTIGLGEVAGISDYINEFSVSQMPTNYNNPLSLGIDVFSESGFDNTIGNLTPKLVGEFFDTLRDELSSAGIESLLSMAGSGLDVLEMSGLFGVDGNTKDYYYEIVESLRDSESVLRDYLSTEAVNNLLFIADEYQDAVDIFNSRMEQYSMSLNPTLQLIPQTLTSYNEMSSGQQNFLSSYVDTFRISADTTEADISRMKQDILRFTDFVSNDANVSSIIDMSQAISSGISLSGEDLSVSAYEKYLSEIEGLLSGYSLEDSLNLRFALGIDFGDVSNINPEIENAINHVKNLLKDEYEANIDDMNISDLLNIYYNISADPNSLTFSDLERLIEEVAVQWNESINVWDFAPLSENLDGIEEKFSNLANSMSTLREGTKLTAGELAKLALEYPELLKLSTLFTDTTIEGQQAMLQSALSSYESEYDAYIDTKIAELTASNQLMEDQIALENEKKNKIIEIADLQNNGKIDSEENYNKLLSDLRDLEGENYVTYSDGILSVNQDMLTNRLMQEEDAVVESIPIFEAQGTLIAEASAKGVSKAYKSFENYSNSISSWANTVLNPLLAGIADNVSSALSGEGNVKAVRSPSSIGSGALNSFLNDIVSGFDKVSLDTVVESNIRIDEKSVDEWSSNYQDVIQERIDTITEQISSNEIIIDNLVRLKGLDLTSIYGESGGSGGGSSDDIVEEYIADIDKYREAIERLNRVRIKKVRLEVEMANTDDLNRHVQLEKELLNVYEGEQAALHNLNNLKDETIIEGTNALGQLGFDITYDRDENKFLVNNLELLNELTADSQGEYETMQDATNALREDTETLIDTLEELNSENQEGSEAWEALETTIRDARINIVSNLKEIVVQATEAVDNIQNVYQTLKNAADEYESNGGFISVDAFQDIVGLGPEYMQYLMDQNGLLVINEANINKVIAAKTQELAVDSAMSYVERLRLATQKESIEDLNNLLYATVEGTNATWGLVYANLALIDLSGDQYQAALHNINAIRSLADNAISGIGQVAGSVDDELNNMKTGLDDILKYVMDMLQDRIERQIDAIEDMKESYGELIDLKKESIDATKEETDYQDSIADKIKEIADLQARINALSLDDSRDAQSQRLELEEEMAKLQEELADEQSDYATESQKESLDKMQEAYEDQKDKEIGVLEDSISSEQKLYEMAIDYIKDNWDSLYDDLISWNTEYGSVLNSEITNAWENCLAAAQRYGSYVDALGGVNADIEDSESSGGGNNNIVGGSGNYDGPTNEERIGSIVNEMWRNSQSYSTASDSKKQELNDRNIALGSMLSQYGVNAVRGKQDGVWYIGSEGGQKLYDAYSKYCYHSGGIAGNKGTLREDELLAKLQYGEAIISNKNKENLYSLIEFVDMLSRKLNSNYVNNSNIPSDRINRDVENISNNSRNSIQIGDVIIYGANDQTVEKHREVTREFTNEIIRQLNIKK